MVRLQEELLKRNDFFFTQFLKCLIPKQNNLHIGSTQNILNYWSLVEANQWTRFVEISPLWQKFIGLFLIWQNSEPTLANL